VNSLLRVIVETWRLKPNEQHCY